MLKEFIKYYKPYKRLFALDMLAAFLVAMCDLIYPMITRNIMNEVVPNQDTRMLKVFAVTLVTIFIVKAFLNYFIQYWGHVVGVRMQADMRSYVFTHLQKLPNHYFNNNKSGVIMSRIINDLNEVSELAHHGPEDLFISGVMLIGSFLILIGINVELTLIVFSIIPIIILYAVFQKRRMSNAFKQNRVKTGDVNATLENSIAGMKVTKSFVTQEQELNKFNDSNILFRDAREGAYKVMGEYFSGMLLLIDILEVIVLIIAGYFTYTNRITLGDFAAYLLYVKMFIQPIKKLINFTEQYQNGMTGFERFLEIINEETETVKEDDAVLENVEGNIEIENVSFNYEGQKQVLDNLNLSIKKGSTVALVGPSGGGKTTICNLIPRFLEFDSGDIKIDNKSIKDININSLRKNIGVVSQDVFLFTGNLRDNIMIGRVDATEEEMIEACKKAKIHEFIETLPKKYDTYIGERGVKLSGGQKQRIAIARIFLKDPAIIILDEATSALDNITEREIQASLEELGKDRTNIVVAHRLTTIKNADEIVLINDGKILEKGNHEELMNLNGEYAKLHR
ncbi:MAG: ABC transporter ATP-binding protein [Peptostreptococcaceae bacterium]